MSLVATVGAQVPGRSAPAVGADDICHVPAHRQSGRALPGDSLAGSVATWAARVCGDDICRCSNLASHIGHSRATERGGVGEPTELQRRALAARGRIGTRHAGPDRHSPGAGVHRCDIRPMLNGAVWHRAYRCIPVRLALLRRGVGVPCSAAVPAQVERVIACLGRGSWRYTCCQAASACRCSMHPRWRTARVRPWTAPSVLGSATSRGRAGAARVSRLRRRTR